MHWVNFFHIYQPPEWNASIVRRVSEQAYRPILTILEKHPQLKITLNLTGSLTEQLAALGMDDVLSRLQALMERGQVELVGSAMYHPILPLLPEEEVRRQIHLQHELHRRVFDQAYHPVGFYAPEMAFGPWMEKILRDLGYRWVIVDEVGVNGQIGTASFDEAYQTPNGFGIVARNRHLSDFLSFKASIDQADEAWNAMAADKRSTHHLITAMDGENLGHHRVGVDRLWERLATHPGVTTMTVSEYLESLPKRVTIKPLASSWSSQSAEVMADVPFGLWNHPENSIHKLQWRLTHVVIGAVSRCVQDPNWDAARLLLDQALTSDKYWWASASPWWDVTIVVRETQRLADVVRPLKTLSADIRDQVASLMNAVSSEVAWWEKSGHAKRRQTSYLQATGAVHYMGGGQVQA